MYSQHCNTIMEKNLHKSIYIKISCLSVMSVTLWNLESGIQLLLLQLLYVERALRLGIYEDENAMLGNKKINQAGSFSYLGSIISKDGECHANVKK